MTVREPEFTEFDRALVAAYLAEQADICPSCGHPRSVCRDQATAGSWTVVEETCQPSRVAQAIAENNAGGKRRGLVLSTRRTSAT